MAKKTGDKSQGNKQGNGKNKHHGSISDSQARKIRSIDEILGMKALDFGFESEILTPKSSLQHLKIQSEVRHSFNEWLQSMHKSTEMVASLEELTLKLVHYQCLYCNNLMKYL